MSHPSWTLAEVSQVVQRFPKIVGNTTHASAVDCSLLVIEGSDINWTVLFLPIISQKLDSDITKLS